ncbi:MAG: DsbA family protein [Hyphomicrobiaceae bacterium]|nr:MAG: DsbA family protein [Hyphomicrobiaceae bacterium]
MSDAKAGRKKVDDLVKDVKGKVAKADAQTGSMLSTLLIVAAVVAVLGGGYYYYFLRGTEQPASQTVDVMAPQPLPDITLGDDKAKVTIVEYASLTCPHCAAFHSGTLPELKKKYIDTGKVRLILRGLPLNQPDLVTQMLSRCVPADKYYQFTGAVFDNQRQIYSVENIEASLKAFSRQAGFTEETFKSCVENEKLRGQLIEMAKIAGEKYGVDSTPTFFVNGVRFASQRNDIASFEKVIEPLLK